MKKLILAFVLLIPTTSYAQDVPLTLDPPPAVTHEVRGTFHTAMIKAINDSDLNRRESLKLRIALLSPAFRAHCEDLALIQIYYSGEENVPMNTSGGIDRTAIDWSGLGDFLERMVPILIELLKLFGG